VSRIKRFRRCLCSFAIANPSDEEAEEIGSFRMDPQYDHLNAMMAK
jgi:hypothetical protein